MKLLILGAEGFLGKNVAETLQNDFDTICADRTGQSSGYGIDLAHKEQVTEALRNLKPDYIINCAGVVENSERADINPVLTKNLLDAVIETKLPVKRIIITGSAGEYGVVDEKQLPVSEETPLHPTNRYAESKVAETRLAETYAREYGLPVVVARLFNPLGPGMHPRFLTSSLIRQLGELEAGQRETIEVNRLDSKRDYVDVRDIASGIVALLMHELSYSVYNIGSGNAVSNATIISLLANCMGANGGFKVTELASGPEPLFACQANITRIKQDTGWRPSFILKDTIGGIVNEKRNAE